MLDVDPVGIDDAFYFSRINRLMKIIMDTMVTVCGATVLTDSNPSETSFESRSYTFSLPGYNHFFLMRTGGKTNYNDKSISLYIRTLDNTTNLPGYSTLYYSSSGTVSTKAYLRWDSIFNVFTAQNPARLCAGIPLTDGRKGIIQCNDDQASFYFDDSDILHDCDNNEEVYDRLGINNQEFLIPARIRSLQTNKILDVKPANNLFKFKNMGGYPTGSILSDGEKLYIVANNNASSRYLIG